MKDKNELRKYAKELRKSLDMRTLSEKIVANIKGQDFYKIAQNVMIFYPLEHEVDLRPLLEDNKNFYLPKMEAENLLVCPYKFGDPLEISKFKTLEPTTKPITPDNLDLIFVPALMVDKENYRLGYGGGFYDKFLSKIKCTDFACAVPSALIVDKLPHDNFDIKMNITICE